MKKETHDPGTETHRGVGSKARGLGKPAYVVTNHEYILCFAKRKGVKEKWQFLYTAAMKASYSLEDEKGNYKLQALYLSTIGSHNRYFITLPDGTKAHPPLTLERGGWQFKEQDFLQRAAAGEIVFKKTKTSPLRTEDGSQAAYNIYVKTHMKGGQSPVTLLPEDLVAPTRAAKALLNSVLGKEVFSYAKPLEPLELLKLLVSAAGGKDALVLDFFAPVPAPRDMRLPL